MGKSSEHQVKRVLVLGDWLVDEHWVTGIHRSPTSSRTGRTHYRALHSPGSTTQSFCGAGRTASILYSAQESGRRYFDIAGVGIWHPQDTAALTEMLNPASLKGETLHRVTQRSSTYDGPPKLFNLADLDKAGKASDRYGTTRVIRIYQHSGDKITLIERIDWEVAPATGGLTWNNDPAVLDRSELSEFLELRSSPVAAVVVKDLCKGVVSPELVSFVRRAVSSDVPWYVSSKEWFPSVLLDELKEVNLRLLLIPPVAAREAVRTDVLNTWITGPGCASRGAIKQIEAIDRALGSRESARIVVLPRTSAILAMQRGRSIEGFLELDTGLDAAQAPLPMASILFGAIVGLDLYDETIPFDTLLSAGLDYTRQWRAAETGRIERPESWKPTEEPPLALKTKSQLKHSTLASFEWKATRDSWDAAFKDCGIVTVNGQKRLELWRAMTEVSNYVCCVSSKRKVLQKLVKALRSFTGETESGNVSCMVVAPPGSGKTHLVQCLARTVGLRDLRFNITQMVTKTDILDCFDTIVTTQAQSAGEPVLVFVDEINARLDNQHVYDSFLAPLDESVYVRAGKTFHLEPCLWLFAGTKTPSDSIAPGLSGSEKASDFESRLSIPPLDLRNDGSSDARVEKVYLGASILRATYPDVLRVSEKVLSVFHRMRTDMEVREVVHFVRAFDSIQYGKVMARNVPLTWLQEYQHAKDDQKSGVDVDQWKNTREGDMVEIVG